MFGSRKQPSQIKKASEAVTGVTPAAPGFNRSVERLIEQGTARLNDLMAPPDMRIHENYIDYEDGCCCELIIAYWPATLSVGWFRQVMFMASFKVDVSMHIHPVPRAFIEHYLNTQGGNVDSSIEAEQQRGKTVQTLLTDRAADIQLMKERVLGQNKENFFQMSMVVTVYGDDRDDLAENVKAARALLQEAGLVLKPFYQQQREGVEAALPWGIDGTRSYHNFYTSALATGFPFMTSRLRVPDGVYHGDNSMTNVPIFYDNYNKPDLSGGGFNVAVMGGTGSGKSFWTKVITSRYALRGLDVMVIDPSPQEEYRKFADYLGGTQVEVSPSGGTVLNPFELVKPKAPAPGEEKVDYVAEKLTFLEGLFFLMGEDALSHTDRVVLGRLIPQLYETKGIRLHDEATYDREAPTMQDLETVLKAIIVAATYPAKELREIETRLRSNVALANTVQGRSITYYLSLPAEDRFTPEEVEAVKHIRTTLAPYIAEGGAKAGLFRGKAAGKANRSVTVFRVGRCPKGLLDLAMYIVFGEIYNRVLAGGGGRQKIVVIDEAWKLLSHGPAAASVRSLIREGRKMGTGTWIMSQRPEEFVGTPEGRDALTQSAMKVMMRCDAEDVRLAVEEAKLPLSANVAARMPGFETGRGIMLLPGGRLVDFVLDATPEEAEMASTTEATVEDYGSR